MKNLLIAAALVFQVAYSAFGQRIEISNAKVDRGTLEIEFAFENNTSRDLFVPGNSSNPAELNYFLSTDEKSKTFIVQRQLFVFPHEIITDLIEPCYNLKTIKAGEVYREKIALGFPLAVNIFPIDHRQPIDKYDSVRVRLGVLPADPVITLIQASREIGHCVMAPDELRAGQYKGKTLIQLQNTYLSESRAIER